MPLDYSNPATIKFLVEKYNKDNVQSVHWFLKHKDDIAQRSQYTEKHKHYTREQIDTKQIECSMSALSKQHEVSKQHRRKHVLDDTVTLNEFFIKSEQPPTMKPVDPNVLSILYTELIAGGGRAAYLNTRKRNLPEHRYTFCETSNIYGWNLGESCVINNAPKYPRYARFYNEVTRLSGAHQDPLHYAPPVAAIYKKCKEQE